MLFQAVVIFLPILNFSKFHVKGERPIQCLPVFYPCTAFQVYHLKLKQGSVTIKAAVTKYRIEILRNAGVSEKVS